MSSVSLKSQMYKRRHSAPGLFCTSQSAKSQSPKNRQIISGWTVPSAGILGTSPKSKQCSSPCLRRSSTEGNPACQASAQPLIFSNLALHRSPESQKLLDDKPLSIVINDASERRRPSKCSQGSNNSKDRNLERKALNVQLLPSELEQVQSFFKSDSPRNLESSSTGDRNEGTRSYRDFLQDFLASNKFNATIGGLILLNTVFMGLELDQHPLAGENEIMMTFWEVPHVPQKVFDGIEVVFFIVFGLEMLLRFVVSGRKLFMEFTTYIDMAALAPVVLVFLFDVQGSKQLTLLRVFRLLKLTRISRLIRLSRELSVLVRSIASSLRSLMWIGVLLLIVVYCSAITCTMLIGHDPNFSDDNESILLYEESYRQQVSIARYWGSTMRSMVTLFQVFTLDDWNGIARPVIETHSPSMILFFILFIFLTTFGLLNLLMGTIVDHSVTAHKDAELEKEKLLQDEHKQMLLITLRLFSIMDLDGNGKLSSAEMLNFFREHNLEDVLHEDLDHFKVKVDYQELLDMCLSIADAWRTDKEDDDDGITIEEFAGAALRLRGNARSRDLLSVHVLTKSVMGRVGSCEKQLTQHGEMMSSMNKKLDQVLELLSAGRADSRMSMTEFCDKGGRYQELRGASSKRGARSPNKKNQSPLRRYRSPNSFKDVVRKRHFVPSLEDESTSADSKTGKQVTDMEGSGFNRMDDRNSSRSSSEVQLPNAPVSPKSAEERLKQVHDERLAAAMQSGMFGQEKVSSFVQQIMTTMPEFANTQSGAAIKSYTLKRSMTRSDLPTTAAGGLRRQRSESLPANALAAKSSAALAARAASGSRPLLRRLGSGTSLISDDRKIKSETSLPTLSPSWLGRKLIRAKTSDHLCATARRRQSAPADLVCQSPLPGWCSDDSVASS